MAKKFISVILVLLVVWLAAGCTQAKTPSPKPKERAGKSKPEPEAKGKVVSVEIKDFAFAPAEVRIGVNDTVDWVNKDAAEHSVHADDESWLSRPLAQDEHFKQSFSQPGTYAYHCHIHLTTMKAKVIVE